MNDYNQVIELVHKKIELMFEVEKITESMSVCPTEELLIHTDARGKAIAEMQLIDDTIEEICQRNSQIRNALNQTCNRDNLPPELLSIYLESLELKTVANRIVKNEDVIRDRIELERQMLLNKIQALNQSGTAVSDKYYKTVKGFVATDNFPKSNITV